MQNDAIDNTLVCHVRTPLVAHPVESRVASINAFEERDFVDRVVLRGWPSEVRMDAETPHHEVIELYERFAGWADRHGVDIHPPFEQRTKASIVDDKREVLVTPSLCLAIYRDERLVSVFPHSHDGETYTVEAAIECLENGEIPRPLGSRAAVPNSGACPTCEADLINGQGMFVCRDCGWTGTFEPEGWRILDEDGETGERERKREQETVSN